MPDFLWNNGSFNEAAYEWVRASECGQNGLGQKIPTADYRVTLKEDGRGKKNRIVFTTGCSQFLQADGNGICALTNTACWHFNYGTGMKTE